VSVARFRHANVARLPRRIGAAVAALLTSLTLVTTGAGQAFAVTAQQGSGGACSAQLAAGSGRYTVHGAIVSGLVRPASIGCTSQPAGSTSAGTGDPARGTPPLTNHGGPVMGTPSVSNQVVMMPIWWVPSGYSFPSGYQDVIVKYLHDVANASNSHSNVFATTTQYSGSNGQVHYHLVVGGGATDTVPFPTSGCTVNSGSVYADGSGYTECLDQAQVQAEVAKWVNTLSSPTDYGHIYILFTPKQVESCFYPGNPSNQQCTLNPTPSNAFCAYHSSYGGTGIYADMPFPIYSSPTGYTCSSEGAFGYGNNEAPNGNVDGDAEVSPLSHEIAEAMTDPNGNAWFDRSGYENGDECAYTYGQVAGSAGAYYNQTIMGDHFLTQEEFSNSDFNSGGGGCIQGVPTTPPSVTSLSPTSGSTAGGTVVNIFGSNFTNASAVTFSGTAASSFTVDSDSEITATTPAHSAGGGYVIVTNPDGTNPVGNSDVYTFQAPISAPTVSSLSPSTGSTTGGTHVTITGTNLTGASAVNFGTTPASSFSVTDATHISAVAPASTSARTVDVTVTTGGGTSATSSNDHFSYVAPPAVTGISPSSGPAAGGTHVTLTGTGFTGATGVKFGATTATAFSVTDDSHIVVAAPAGTGGTSADITVTTPYGTSATSAADTYTWGSAPTVDALTPAAGTVDGGQSVTITGTHLTGATGVSFGDAAAQFTVDSDTLITATTPPGASGTVDVTVTTPYGTSPSSGNDQYTYYPKPVITSVSPTAGPTKGGTPVTIHGRGFASAAQVSFGTAAATSFTVVNSTTIKAVAPKHAAGAVDVAVTSPGGSSGHVAADRYTFLARPVVTAISPRSGSHRGGTVVTITGKNLTKNAAVLFGTVPGAKIHFVSPTKLTVHAPAHARGIVTVSVRNAGGTSAAVKADRYTFT
jgi:hypothetical protein